MRNRSSPIRRNFPSMATRCVLGAGFSTGRVAGSAWRAMLTEVWTSLPGGRLPFYRPICAFASGTGGMGRGAFVAPLILLFNRRVKAWSVLFPPFRPLPSFQSFVCQSRRSFPVYTAMPTTESTPLASSVSTSSCVVMPPAAVTRRAVARLTSRMAGIFVPCISPSASTYV